MLLAGLRSTGNQEASHPNENPLKLSLSLSTIRISSEIRTYRCGDDGKGYKMSFPRGWSSKIGSSLKIGVVVVAAASDAGEVPGLPAPSAEAVAAWAEEGGGARPTAAEMQADLVNAAFDALAGVVPDKLNDMVDSAFMDAETEVWAGHCCFSSTE